MLPASKKISDDGALGATALSFLDERVVRVVEFAAVARANGLFVRRRCWLLLVVAGGEDGAFAGCCQFN